MGVYINPPGETKESFLAREGTPITREAAAQHRRSEDPGHLVVALLDNGPFTAAAVGYCDAETQVFARESRRPVQFFLVPFDTVAAVAPDLLRYAA